MEVKIKTQHWMLKFFPKWVDAFVFNQTIYFRNNTFSERLLKHEYIHTIQYKEIGVLCFLVSYYAQFLYYIIKLRNIDKAYREISFEKQAYALQNVISLDDVNIDKEVLKKHLR